MVGLVFFCIVFLYQFDVIGGEESGLALGVFTHPPVCVDHVDVGDVFAFLELDLIVL